MSTVLAVLGRRWWLVPLLGVVLLMTRPALLGWLLVVAVIVAVAGAAVAVPVVLVRRVAGGARPRRLTAARRREQEESRTRIAAGGLTLPAERRLRELRAGGRDLFTSDLSVNEFRLLHAAGIEPLTQVMGSSVFQHGMYSLPQSAFAWGARGGGGMGPDAPPHQGDLVGGSTVRSDGRGFTQDLPAVSDPFNQARQRALSRLRQEAELAGADAVVGVHITTNGDAHANGRHEVEFVAIGTAVRLPAPLRGDHVALTALSGQEYWQLAQAGYRPSGIVAVTTVTYVASSWPQNQVLVSGNGLWSRFGNMELSDFTHGVYEAREDAMAAITAQAAAVGAAGVVGVTVDVHLRRREYEDRNDYAHHDLIAYVHVLGTAVAAAPAPPASVPDTLTVMSLRPVARTTTRG